MMLTMFFLSSPFSCLVSRIVVREETCVFDQKNEKMKNLLQKETQNYESYDDESEYENNDNNNKNNTKQYSQEQKSVFCAFVSEEEEEERVLLCRCSF